MYERPTITVVGSVREVTLRPIQACKYGWGSDDSMPNDPGIAEGNGKSKENADPSCFVS